MATEPKIRYDIEARATGRAEVEALARELQQLDASFDPAVAQRAEELRRELQQLGQQREAIGQFAELKRATTEAGAELQRAQQQAQAFASSIAGGSAPTRAQLGQLEQLKAAVRGAKTEYQASLGALEQSRAGLQRLGIASDDVAARSTALRGRLGEVGTEIRELATGAAAQAAQRLQQQAQATDAAAAAADRGQQALREFTRAQADSAERARGNADSLAVTTEGMRRFLAASGAAGQGAAAQAARLRELNAAAQQGATDTRALAAQFERLDTSFDPTVANRARELATQLRGLADQQGAIAAFRALKTETTSTAANLERLQAETQAYAATLAGVQQPTQAQVTLLERMRAAVRESQAALDGQRASLDGMRAKLTDLGVPTTQLASAQTTLSAAVKDARAELDRFTTAGSALAGLQQLAAATQRAATEARQADAALGELRAEIASGGSATQAQAARLAELTNQQTRTAAAARQAAAAQADAAVAARAAGASYDAIAAAQGRAAAAASATVAAGQRVAQSWRDQATAATASAAQQNAAAATIGTGFERISSQLRGLQTLAATAVGGTVFTQLLGDVLTTADAYTNLAARIKLVTGEGQAFDEAFKGVYETALKTNTSLEGTGTLFARVAQAGKEIGVSQQDALRLTESINQAIQLSGGSAASADAAITQLIQGLQSGVLRGEEFNSVMEQAPRLAQALAAGLGVTGAALRDLAKNGELTSEVVIKALQSQAATLEKEFGKLPETVGRALQNLSTEWSKFVGTLDSSTGASATVAQGINALADNLDTVARVATVAGGALTASLAVAAVGALKSYAASATTAAGATSLMSATIAKIPPTVNIVVAAVGLEVGYEIGKMLYENSELARKLGVGIVGFLQQMVSGLTFLKDAAVAVFTDATVAQAFDDWKARSADLWESTKILWEEAEKSPEVVRAAADAAAAATQRMGTAATATAQSIATAGAAGAAGLAQVGAKADETSKAISALATAAGVQLPASAKGADALAFALAMAAQQSSATAGKIARELPEAISKLSGPELQNFSTSFTTALKNTGDQANLLGTVLTAVGKQAAQSLGVDVAGAGTTLSAEFVKAQDNLAILVQTLPQLAAAGIDTGAVLEQALMGMIDAARNETELAALRTRILALGEAGKLAKPSVDQLLDGIKQKSAEAKAGIQGVDEALRLFGLQSRGDMQKTADVFKQAWETIKNDATVSIAAKREAFAQYAQATIAANGGVVTSELAVQAEILKLKISVDETGRAIVSSTEAGAKGFDALGQRIGQVREQVNQTAGALSDFSKLFDKFTKSSLTYDKQGFATDPNGNRIGIEQQVDIPEGGYFDEDAFRRESQNAARLGQTPPDPQRFVRGPGGGRSGGNRVSGPPGSPGSRNTGGSGALPTSGMLLGPRGAVTPSPAPAPVSPAPAPAPLGSRATRETAHSTPPPREVVMRLDLGNGNTARVPTTEEGMRAFWNAMQQAARSAGITHSRGAMRGEWSGN